MHPVIKEVVKRVINIKDDGLLRFLSGLEEELSDVENPEFENSMFLISCAEIVWEYLSDNSKNLVPQLIYNISMRYARFGIYDKALKNINICLNIFEGKKDMEKMLGSAYDLKGYIFYYTFNYEQAEESYIKAYEIRKKLKNKKHLAQTVSSLALLYQGMWGELKDKECREATKVLRLSLNYQKMALQLFEKIFSGKKQDDLEKEIQSIHCIQYSCKDLLEHK